jgi:predicted amino acid racemase
MTKSQGIAIWGVTKVLGGAPSVAQALLEAGVEALADSRLSNLQKIQAADLPGWRVLLRPPSPKDAERTVALTSLSLNSELETIRALSQAAQRQGKSHAILLMVDLGDLREGVWPTDLAELARQASRLPGISLMGLGTNLTCFGGVVPSPTNLGQLVSLAEDLESAGIMQCQIISGGNSSSLQLLTQGGVPRRINNLRLGESIILGRETLSRSQIPGLFIDAVTIWAEVIEVSVKPSVPIGQVAQDAFGHRQSWEDRGPMRRAILALGRQDVNPDGLTPLEAGVKVLGASSDHLLLDTTDHSGLVSPGTLFGFVPDYGALLVANTCPDVHKIYH